jgi:GST-like protein
MSDERKITLLGVASPNVVKVAIMLEELGLAYELRHVALFRGEQFTPEFRALNPVGKVPVLLDSELEQPLAESGAILIWLAEHAGRLLPSAGVERYEVMQWLMVQMSSVGPMLGQYTHFRLLPEGSEPYSFGRYGTLAETLYRLLDERVATREWMAGGAYSIADIAIFPWAEYLDRHGFSWEDFPHLARWRDTVGARPAVVRGKERIAQSFLSASAEGMRSASDQDLDRFFGRTGAMPKRDFRAVTRAS